nr:TlpA family protein disulfide reductase [Pseudopedobacter sp.]
MKKITQINQQPSKNLSKWLNWSNISAVIFVVFIGVLLISPTAKGMVIQGLMKIGLFQPDIPNQSGTTVTNNSKNVEKTGVLFKDENGKVFDLADFKDKVVFINFWTTWCPPCIAEMPSINKLQHKYKDNKDIVILMVNADNQLEKSQVFMKKNNYDLKVFTPASQIPSELLEQALPTTVLLNKKGEIAFRHEGGADYENKEFQKFIEKLASE